MNRKDFMKQMALLSIGTPFMSSLLASCGKDEDHIKRFDVNFNGKVLIIGAGAAGLISGYALKQHGIDFQIIEASSVFGGRIKKIDDFADFPIDLGAEWIHTDPSILAALVNDKQVKQSIETIVYNPQTIKIWKNGKLRDRNFINNFYSEYKFKNTTWFDFLADYIEPAVSNNITYNTPITAINYSGADVVLETATGETLRGDRVIVTIPISLLKQNSIAFTPQLPASKLEALNRVSMPPGIKIFASFSKRFYPDLTAEGNLMDFLSEEPKLWYDAAFGKASNQNILGLFFVDEEAIEFTDLPDDEARLRLFLDQLDEMYDGQASKYYQKHVIQNWSALPYIQGSYSFYESYSDGTMETLAESIANKVYFAGEAYDAESPSTAHGAGESAFNTVKALVETA